MTRWEHDQTVRLTHDPVTGITTETRAIPLPRDEALRILQGIRKAVAALSKDDQK